MAPQKDESKGAEKPPFDPSKLLGKLQDLAKGQTKESGGGKSWIATLVLLAVALIGVGIWAWKRRKHAKELARLRHQENKAKILEEKAELARQLAKDSSELDRADREIRAAADRVSVLEAEIRAEEARYDANLRAIDRIRSWRDVHGDR